MSYKLPVVLSGEAVLSGKRTQEEIRALLIEEAGIDDPRLARQEATAVLLNMSEKGRVSMCATFDKLGIDYRSELRKLRGEAKGALPV
jgi:hypothetical protein